MLLTPHPPSPTRGHAGRGLSVIELMITIALAALLLGLAVPSLSTWIRNAQIRTVTDSLQNGLRLAQAEAVRRQRQVVFFLSANPTCDTTNTATANGRFWVVRTVSFVGDAAEVVQCGVLAEADTGTTITGPTALCFSSAGRLVAIPDPGVGGSACVVAGLSRYAVSRSSGTDLRPLQVTVSMGGQTRLCDPARTLSDTQPDGCPP